MRSIKYQEKPDVNTTSKSPIKECIPKTETECDYKHIFKVPTSKALIENVLDFSPFNFYQGINPKRLLKGRALLQKNILLTSLSCGFCNNIFV